MSQARKIIFVHIPKTAGTTLTDYLCAFFPPHCIYSGMTMLDYQAVDINSLLNFDLLKGHIFYHFIESNPGFDDYSLITVLRDPVQRVISLYRFWRSHPEKYVTDQSIHVAIRRRIELAKTLSLYDFVHSQDQIVQNSIANSQTRQLSSASVFKGFHQHSENTLFNDAMNNLSKFDIVGVVENLCWFYKSLKQQFGFPDEQKLLRTNVSDKSEQLWSNHNEYSEIKNQINKLNTVDLRIYQHYKQHY